MHALISKTQHSFVALPALPHGCCRTHTVDMSSQMMAPLAQAPLQLGQHVCVLAREIGEARRP